MLGKLLDIKIKGELLMRFADCVWANTTHMHFRTHSKPTSLGQPGRWQSEYHDVMIEERF
jgi:hypothetical protein